MELSHSSFEISHHFQRLKLHSHCPLFNLDLSRANTILEHMRTLVDMNYLDLHGRPLLISRILELVLFDVCIKPVYKHCELQ